MDGLPIVVGPTGVGKSKIALRLAERLGAEIISADSRQIYRFMDIGTAKPSPEEQRRVKHHFIDILYPDQDYSAGDFGQQARAKIESLLAEGRAAIVVGGSGLYIRALIDGFFDPRVADKGVREELCLRAERQGLSRLYEELSGVDPDSARRIHPNDRQRILRALEVYRITKRSISSLWRGSRGRVPGFQPVFFGLNRDRKELYARIEERVGRMIEAGLVDEVKGLMQRGYGRNLNSMQTVGYQEILSHLEGECGLEEAIRLIKRNTKRYAKRQLTWFRKDGRIEWTDLKGGDEIEDVAQRLFEKLEKS